MSLSDLIVKQILKKGRFLTNWRRGPIEFARRSADEVVINKALN
jgi:hypothetical protein